MFVRFFCEDDDLSRRCVAAMEAAHADVRVVFLQAAPVDFGPGSRWHGREDLFKRAVPRDFVNVVRSRGSTAFGSVFTAGRVNIAVAPERVAEFYRVVQNEEELGSLLTSLIDSA